LRHLLGSWVSALALLAVGGLLATSMLAGARRALAGDPLHAMLLAQRSPDGCSTRGSTRSSHSSGSRFAENGGETLRVGRDGGGRLARVRRGVPD
jgi:hypothetical protein